VSALINATESALKWAQRMGALDKACDDAKLTKLYSKADQDAISGRRRHRQITVACVVSGAAALLLGVVQLSAGAWNAVAGDGVLARIVNVLVAVMAWFSGWPWWIELPLILVGVGAVGIGYYYKNDDWLFLRYSAERFRSLRFNVLIDPRFCTEAEPPAAEWKLQLRAEIDEVERTSAERLVEVAEYEEEPKIPDPVACRKANLGLAQQLVGYYRKERLEPQIDYLFRLIERERRNFLDNRLVQPAVFILSVLFVVPHVAFEIAADEAKNALLRRLSDLCLFASAAIPILWTAFRTWRSANENARNVSRSRAKLAALRERSRNIDEEITKPEPSLFRLFTALALTENLLRNELNEWLRLMRDAEWYG
jgi:hypothetical protein